MFLRQLAQAAGQCTLIMVTHRPAVLELVQRVVVVDSGKVVHDGPKADVLAALAGKPATPPAQQAAPQPPAAPPPPAQPPVPDLALERQAA
jgi:ATP-binding cassette subfamily C protein LapB